MKKLFDWRVVWDDHQMVGKTFMVMSYYPCAWLQIKSLPFSVEGAELDFLNGKGWLLGKDRSGKFEVATDTPLWKGKKDVTLILHSFRCEADIEKWHLKGAEVEGKTISYEDYIYEGC